jgi:hypothetical protein
VKPPASFSTLGSEFDDFLFAAIGEDSDGMPLSVVSALARMDLDPWHEAASLAAVSVEAATGKLTSLLAALPDPALRRLDPGTTAARLTALLPQRPDSNARSSAAAVVTLAVTHPPDRLRVILVAIYIILLLGTQFVLISRPPPTHADTAHPSAPPAAAPHLPPASSGK